MTVFADTFYFLALLSVRDAAHQRAIQATRALKGRLLTTAWVITELADGMASERNRKRFLEFFDRLSRNPQFSIVPCSAPLFDQGIELFR